MQLTQWQGAAVSSYPVSIKDVGTAFGKIGSTTGVLHPNVVFQSQRDGEQKIGWFVESQKWTVGLISSGEKHLLEIPLPPFIFIGSGKRYGVVAVEKRPLSENEPIFHFPSPNLSGPAGSICWGSGSGSLPKATMETMAQVANRFVSETWFNDHQQNGRVKSRDVHKLWLKLHNKRNKTFPKRELIQAGTVRDLL